MEYGEYPIHTHPDQRSGSETPGASWALLLAGVDHAHPQRAHAEMLRLIPVLRKLFPVHSLRGRLFFLLPLDAYDEELCRYHISPGVLATVLGGMFQPALLRWALLIGGVPAQRAS